MTHADLLRMISQLSTIIDDLEYLWPHPYGTFETSILRQLCEMREMVRHAASEVTQEEVKP